MKHDRPGILGLETEHVIFFVPEEAQFLSEEGVAEAHETAVPPFEVIQQVLFESLLRGRKAALSGGPKGGYFLENGGLVHLELYLHSQSDVPVLEAATPECRTPQDLLVYSRAFDAILEETSVQSVELFKKLGFQGRLAFGKSNADAKGTGLGCHENYLVHTRTSLAGKCLLACGIPFLLLCVFPVYLLFLLEQLREFLPTILPGPRRTAAWLRRSLPRALALARKLYFALSTTIIFPFTQLYSFLVRRTVLRRHIRELTPFLVTRQILAGAGRLNFEGGAYELSQRSPLTRRLAGIVVFGGGKTIFDLKGILFDRANFLFLNMPFWLFQPTKRLSLALGDSNLSDAPNLFKLGATSLLIEMLEAGETFEDLHLRRPVRALRQISRQGPWWPLKLRSGQRRTALEIQGEYLRRAKRFFLGRGEGTARQVEILQLWEELLEKLSDRPHALSSELDWAAKKHLLDQAILAQTNWKVFLAWGRVFAAAGLEAVAESSSFRELIGKLGYLRRLRATKAASLAGLDPAEFILQRDLHFQARKIDLKYHELGGGTSYQRALESHGLIRRLADPAQIEKAVRTAPQDTRARVRSYYIQQSRRPEALLVNWNEIELQTPLRYIQMQDPFQFRLPME